MGSFQHKHKLHNITYINIVSGTRGQDPSPFIQAMIFFYRICQLLLSAANLVNLIYDIYITDEFVTHIFIGYSTMNVSIYSENRRDIYFSLPKTIKHGRQK